MEQSQFQKAFEIAKNLPHFRDEKGKSTDKTRRDIWED